MILVTEGTGLVGAHLLLHLIENQKIETKPYVLLSDIASKTESLFAFYKRKLLQQIRMGSCRYYRCSIFEIAFQNINTVYHCAL
jgi:nucleoside-diphosphate-sugar epimerase